MASRSPDLIRQHARTECRFAAEVAPVTDTSSLRLARHALEHATEHIVLVDFSEGGLGLRSPVFFPRGAVLRVTIRGLEGADQVRKVEFVVRVQRTVMQTREPSYYLGTAFVETDAAAPLLAHLRGRIQANISEAADANRG